MSENQERIWDYFQTEGRGRFASSVARLRFLARQLAPGGRILNIGVGGGAFEEIAQRMQMEVYCLDPSEPSIASIRARLGLGSRAMVGRCEAIPTAGEFFDAVVVSELLEHLSEDALDRALAEIRRVLVVGGRLVGTVPAREDLAAQLVICPDCGARFHRWGHLQAFDRPRLASLLARYFAVEKMYERPFVAWSTLNWKGRIDGLARIALHTLGVRGSNDTIVFVVRRA